MLRRYRFALRPGWVALHLVCLAAVITMVLLGRWQLVVSENKHFDVRNFGYALQWWAFSAFVIVMWVRIMRDQGRRDVAPNRESAAAPEPSAQEPVTYRRYVMPQMSDATPEAMDETQTAYNEYLRRLATEDTGRPSSSRAEGST